MQLPYFYQNLLSINNKPIVLNEETSKHCVQVLRMKFDEKLQLTDGLGKLITAKIIEPDKKKCVVELIESATFESNKRKISIAISLIKNSNRFEWFLEKATEIGVAEIIPIVCRRTEKQHFRFDRMNGILVAAMLQSRQTFLPVLSQPILFKDVLNLKKYTNRLIAHCLDEQEKKSINTVNLTDEIQILIGPEGDFTVDEIEMALQNNYQAVMLGNTRLRTETAGVVAAILLANN